MSRWSNNLDDPWQTESDRFFTGLNSKLHRSVLPEGTVPVSINKRFTDNRAAPRKGSSMPRGNQFWTGFDQKFLGSFLYTNPSGQERVVLVPTAIGNGTQGINCYDIQNDHYITIELPPGIVIGPNGQVWFAQGFGNLIMLVVGLQHNDNTGRHLTNGMFWNGDESDPQPPPPGKTRWSGRIFNWFEWNGVTGLTQVIPPSVYVVPIGNRMGYWASLLPANDIPAFSLNGPVYDHLLISDAWGSSEVDPYQNMDPILQDFRINTGSTDVIVTVIPYAFDSAIVFMKKSIMQLSNFSIDPTQAQISVLSAYFGCCGVRAAVQIGSEIYFVASELGLFKLTEILDQRIVAEPLPISDAIQPDIDRINWQAEDAIILAYESNYLYLAAPVDGSTRCNVIFVLNLTTGQWESIDNFDTIPNFHISNILAAHVNGVRRLLVVQNGPPALLYLLYEGHMDQTVFDPIHPRFAAVNDYMETRGYGLNKDSDPTAWGTFHRGSVVIETLNPNVEITAISEGVNENKVLRQSITKDRNKFYIHGKPDFDSGLDGWTDPKREDYTHSSGDNFDAQDFSMMGEGDLMFADNEQVIPPLPPEQLPDDPQVSRERFPIRVTDRWLSLSIRNIQGTCTVVSTAVELTESRRNARSAA